jgi:RNase P protein component
VYNRIWQQRYRFQQAQLFVEEEAKHIAKEKEFLERIHVALSISMNTNRKAACRSIANVARTIAMSIAYFLKGFDVVVYNKIMEKVVGHDLLGVVMPSYLHDTKKIKHNQLLINNLKFKLSGHVTRQ